MTRWARIGLVVVSALVLATLVVTNVMRNLGTTVCPKETTDILTLESACESYAEMHGGASPTSLDELVRPDAQGATLLRGTRLPLDRWGRAYLYEPADAGHRFVRIGTLGRDGLPGGEDDDADMDNATIRAGIEGASEPHDSGRQE